MKTDEVTIPALKTRASNCDKLCIKKERKKKNNATILATTRINCAKALARCPYARMVVAKN